MTDNAGPDLTAERRDEVVKRMLATPPRPHKANGEDLSGSEAYVAQRKQIEAAQVPPKTR